jgi:hypothetical protein
MTSWAGLPHSGVDSMSVQALLQDLQPIDQVHGLPSLYDILPLTCN